MTSKTIIFDKNLAYVKNLPYLCAEFNKTIVKVMKKMKYIQPQMDTIVMPARALMDFQASPTNDPHNAPKRVEVAPSVPGEPL